MNVHSLAHLQQTVSPNSNVLQWDIIKIKSALQSLGFYKVPEWGMSPYPDMALFDAIKSFQSEAGLQADGVMKPNGETQAVLLQSMSPYASQNAWMVAARALQDMGRGGDEILAHITPEEAQLLHEVTDGVSINPQTGLMEFYASPDMADAVNDSVSESLGGGSAIDGLGSGGHVSTSHSGDDNGETSQNLGANHRGQPDIIEELAKTLEAVPDLSTKADETQQSNRSNRNHHYLTEEEIAARNTRFLEQNAKANNIPTRNLQVAQSFLDPAVEFLELGGKLVNQFLDGTRARRAEAKKKAEAKAKAERDRNNRAYEKHMQSLYGKDYKPNGINFGAKHNNTYGTDGSKKAVGHSVTIQGSKQTGKAMQTFGTNKGVRGIGKAAEKYGKNLEDKFMSDDYNPHNRSFLSPWSYD